jgi:hypothetical protein
MIKLTDILKEILQESNIIKIPQSELDKADRVYKFIKSNFDKLVIKSKNRTINKPLILPTLENYFKIDDYQGDPVKVSIGFYQDNNDPALGRMDPEENNLLININNVKEHNLLDFKELIEHELVHAIDPKIKKTNLFNREYAKKGAKITPGVSDEEHNKLVTKYLKSPWEFDAFTAPLINKIKRNIAKSDDPSKMKDLLNQYFSDLRTKEPDELASESKYELIPWIFNTVEWDSNNINKVSADYELETGKMKVWLSKPTLYTRFLKRLFRNI